MKNSIYIYIFITFLLLLLLIFYSVSTISNVEKAIDSLTINIHRYNSKIDSLESFIDSSYSIKVTATMYHPTKYQCDNTPNQLADGTYINIYKASQYNFIAISRDLLIKNGGKFKMGDFVKIINANHKSGIYQIRDKMNRRFTKRIDFLESPGTSVYKYCDVVLIKSTKNLNT